MREKPMLMTTPLLLLIALSASCGQPGRGKIHPAKEERPSGVLRKVIVGPIGPIFQTRPLVIPLQNPATPESGPWRERLDEPTGSDDSRYRELNPNEYDPNTPHFYEIPRGIEPLPDEDQCECHNRAPQDLPPYCFPLLPNT